VISPEKKHVEEPKKEEPAKEEPLPSLETLGDQNVVIIPSSTEQLEKSEV
jgi:hypothetical protein